MPKVKSRTRKRNKVDWEVFADEIFYKVSRALDRWCWEVSGDSPLECYSAYMNRSLYDLAQEFSGWSYSGITDKDLELLSKMPDEVYRKYDMKLRSTVEGVVDRLSKGI